MNADWFLLGKRQSARIKKGGKSARHGFAAWSALMLSFQNRFLTALGHSYFSFQIYALDQSQELLSVSSHVKALYIIIVSVDIDLKTLWLEV